MAHHEPPHLNSHCLLFLVTVCLQASSSCIYGYFNTFNIAEIKISNLYSLKAMHLIIIKSSISLFSISLIKDKSDRPCLEQSDQDLQCSATALSEYKAAQGS